MAITLSSQQRRRRQRNSLGSKRLRVDDVRKSRRRGPLQRWMDPFDKLRSIQTSRIIIIDSSDDESAAQFDHVAPNGSDDRSNSLFAGGKTEIDDFGSSEDDTPKHSDDEDQTTNEKPFKRIYFNDVLYEGKTGTKQCKAATSGGDSCGNCALDTIDYCRLHGSYEKVKRIIEFKKVSNLSDSITITSGEELEEGRVNNRAGSEADDLNQSDSSYASYIPENSGAKGQEKCAAITVKGKPCSLNAAKHSSFCLRHESYGLSKKGGSLYSGKAGSKNNDRIFTGKKQETRCAARVVTGEVCPYQPVKETRYCIYHTNDNPTSLQESIMQTSGSDSDNASADTSLVKVNASTDEDSELELSDDEEGGDALKRPYKYKEFIKMWRGCEDFFGEMTDEIESTRRVRGANSRMLPEDTDGQLKAQYGRLLPRAMKKLMTEILELSKEDTFLDIGHGIGNACVQAAYTFGCESRGIEVVYDRNAVAEVFRDNLTSLDEQRPVSRLVGQVILRHGRLEDEQHQDFLTGGVTRAYVNNFNGVFADRSSKGNQKWFLDDYVAGLFALMASGTIMVTLHPLNLGPTKSEANNSRKKQGLTENENSSFYEVEKVLLGKACDTVKWNQHSGNQRNIYVYKYTRVAQPSPGTVFLCCNPICEIAQGEVPIPATTKNEEGRVVINHCECRITAKNLRRQRRKIYT